MVMQPFVLFVFFEFHFHIMNACVVFVSGLRRLVGVDCFRLENSVTT